MKRKELRPSISSINSQSAQYFIIMNDYDAMAHSSDDRCVYCGAPINIKDFDKKSPVPQIMARERLCFTCAFWKEKIENPHPDREIVNGFHYVINPWLYSRGFFQGFGGKSMYLLRNNGTVTRSNNVWCQGEIPERFRSQLPNTARFITRRAYDKIKNNIYFTCNKKGCWDRYHCYFYDPEQEKANGAWNTIPDNYVVGSEGCELFLDKNKTFIE